MNSGGRKPMPARALGPDSEPARGYSPGPEPPAGQDPQPPGEEPQSQGPNLFLVYGLIALGLLLAMIVAALIVWPFYKSR